jgi:glycosyltransferase involved in cell wall biosynthesis
MESGALEILFLSPDVPYPLNDGVSQRVYHFLRSLSRQNRVTLLALLHTSEKAAHMKVFEEMGIETHFEPVELNAWRTLRQRFLDPIPDTIHHWLVPGLKENVLEFVRRRRCDLIHCEDLSMASQLVGEDIPSPVVTDRTRVDLEFQTSSQKFVKPILRRVANTENLFKLRRFERRVLRQFPHQVVCSDDDFNFLRRAFGVSDTLCIVRNGIDETYFHEMDHPQAVGRPTLVFTGAMHYNPNIDAMQWFFGEIHERLRPEFPELRVVIAGKNPTREIERLGEIPGVEVTGAVPDIRPYYAQADVFIVPIRIGGGTRLKIVEAMAMGRAVVSTTIGSQGLDLVDGTHLLKADDAGGFADAVARFLKDATFRRRIAQEGQRFVLDHFTWNRLGQELETFYRKVVSRAKA